MRVVIMGCGRTGSLLAAMLDGDGHDVAIVDWNQSAFTRLPDAFRGRTIVGNGVDQDVLRLAGVESAEAFVAATSGDNRNIMAAQIAQHMFRVPRVISRIKDPIRAAIYGQLGIEVDCRTIEGVDAILELIGESAHPR
ncbi:MAG: TrkA family potassium uptake protein [Chloroflexi bacterium]|nr:TrkA family potassium uptake protein [Chloroflexota bacterium]